MRPQIAIGILAAAAVALYAGPSWTGAAASLAVGLLTAGLIRAARTRRVKREIAETSQILETASARVHQISAATAPKRRSRKSVGPIDNAPDIRWRYLDVTVQIPDWVSGGEPAALPLWTPGLLKVVGPGAQSGEPNDQDRFGSAWCEVARVDIMQGGNWEPLQGDKVLGSQRLRLLIGVPPGHDQFKLRYGFVILDNAGQTLA